MFGGFWKTRDCFVGTAYHCQSLNRNPSLKVIENLGFMISIWVETQKKTGSPKWMVKIMENPIKMDDLRGFPIAIFLETPYMDMLKGLLVLLQKFWNLAVMPGIRLPP